MTPATLPSRSEVRPYGRGKSYAVRVLWRERCSVEEICASLGVSFAFVSCALRWKARQRLWP